MSIFKLIQQGFQSIFGFKGGMSASRKALEEFSKNKPTSASEDFDKLVESMNKSDRQRLRDDWATISQDLGRAYEKAKKQLSISQG